MAKDYPILLRIAGMDAKTKSTTVHDLMKSEGLLDEPSIVNFAVYQWDLSREVERQFSDTPGRLVGYSRHYGFPMISDPESDSGLVEIFERKLVYVPKATPLHMQRDGYVYLAIEEYYCDRTFEQVIEEFLDQGYGLFWKNMQSGHTYSKDPRKFQDLEPLTLEQLFSDDFTFGIQ